jgi:hypothetical protein
VSSLMTAKAFVSNLKASDLSGRTCWSGDTWLLDGLDGKAEFTLDRHLRLLC